MVSKPNPYGDELLRKQLYYSYQRQMPMWDHPGDFVAGRSLNDGGCFNCNAAFKLGSGNSGYAAPYNAIAAPEQFFYLPATTGGRRPRRPRRKIDNMEYQTIQKEADSDWYSLVKELVPLGFQIADIVKIFYNMYVGKYGGEMMNDLLNLEGGIDPNLRGVLGGRTNMRRSRQRLYNEPLPGVNKKYEDESLIHKEAQDSLYSLIKDLVPMGFQLADIIEGFYNKYQQYYGGNIINDVVNLNIKFFQDMAQRLGEHQYM